MTQCPCDNLVVLQVVVPVGLLIETVGPLKIGLVEPVSQQGFWHIAQPVF